MRHQRNRHKLSRDAAHRKALLQNLSKQLIEHERIETTVSKAKAVKPEVEKLITLAKRGDVHARRLAHRDIRDQDVLKKLFSDIGPRFKTRNGGYTRITKSRMRRGDNATLSILELVGSEVPLAGGGETKSED